MRGLRIILGTLVGIFVSLLFYSSVDNINLLIPILEGTVLGYLWHVGAISNYDKGFREGVIEGVRESKK